MDISVLGDYEETVGGTHKITAGRHELSAVDSTETIAGTKKIVAGSLNLGCQVSIGTGTGGQPICGNATALLAWLTGLSEVLMAAGMPVPPPPPIVVSLVTARV
jgi:hypothetical protein